MKEIVAYQASDSTVFTDKNKCECHDRILYIKELYEKDHDDALFVSRSGVVDWDTFYEWASTHTYLLFELSTTLDKMNGIEE